MIRILHFADLHLGVETYGRIDPATGLSSRLGDFLAALDEVVDFALSQEVDLVLFCGDAYKNREPSQTCQRELARRIRRLVEAGVPVFLLVGNHDLPAALSRATAVEIFHTLAVKNVYVASRPGTHLVGTRQGPVQIVALPWARVAGLLAREETRGLTLDQLNQALQQRLTSILEAQAQSLAPALPALLAAHVALSTALPGSERGLMLGRDYVLLPGAVSNPAFDYVALGHIHRHQVLHQSPPTVYSGSLQGIDFSEEGEEKGFVMVELDPTASRGGRVLRHDFVPVQTRPFVTIKAVAQGEDPTAAVLKAIAKKDVQGAIVRLEIRVSGDAQVRDAEVSKALEGAHYLAISKEVERDSRVRLRGHRAEALTPLEALGLYLDTRKTPPERARVLLEYGERLIQEHAGTQ